MLPGRGAIFALDRGQLRAGLRGVTGLNGQSKGGDLQPRTRLGVTQNTAWKLAHKLMRVMMERDAGKRLTGRVEIDDASLGGGRSGGKRGRGAPGKTPIIVAMETNARGRAGAPEAAPGRRLAAQGGGKAGPAQPRSPQHRRQRWPRLLPRYHQCGCTHQPIRTGGGRTAVRPPAFKWVNTALGSNIKTAITAT